MLKKSSEGVCLSLDKAIYSSGAVNSAVSGFSGICSVSAEESGGKHVVRFSGLPTEELEHVALEFANYALSCVKAGC